MTKGDKISVGVGAVVFRGNDILIIKRGKPPFEGQWSIPGGGLEYGETVKDAVRREIREETGIEIHLVALLDVFDAIRQNDSGEGAAHTVIIDYVAEWKSGEPVAADDATAAEFVSQDEAMRRLSWDVTRQAIRRAVEIRNSFRMTS
jgi:8-oxo-dGTP diphosphatase